MVDADKASLGKAELAAALARVRDYQQVLAAFSRNASQALPRERLLHHAAAQVARVTHIKHAKVLRYRPDKGDLLLEAGVGWKPGIVGHATLGIDSRSPPGRTMQTGAPVTVEDLPNDPEYRYSELLRNHGIVSLLNVPVMIDGRTWGVLEVDTVQATKFDEWDVDFMSTFANMIGGALARLEAEQKAIEAGAQISRNQAHAEIVLKELQHRVKNNLQAIVGFLAVKRRDAQAHETREHLSAAIGRVQAIALAHDLLSSGDQASSIDFGDYLRTLCANINPAHEAISIEVDAPQAIIPLDRAVPAGLVVNELITNSIKYAFGNAGGKIRVVLEIVGNASEASVCIEDDGKGMELPPKRGLGLRLVEGFAQQLGGRVDYVKVDTGSRTVLCFPVAF
jgi:two-component sensor histidine kinase/putative methionine-R-sulfoxide reductase with GAF domain